MSDVDREIFHRELDRFVPPQVFDAHAHLYAVADFPAGAVPALCRQGPAEVGAEFYRARMNDLLPGRRIDGLFFGFPTAEVNIEGENRFVADQVATSPGSRGQMLVTPAMDRDAVRGAVQAGGFAGLKCYHVFSAHRPTFESPIDGFLTDAHLEVADALRLTITLHIVRARALADERNQAWIRRACQRYPSMNLILAHAARGFNPHHTVCGIDALGGLENVWFDTSAVTDCGAIEAIGRVMGHRRLLYGSDFPVSHIRGRCVGIGDSFVWLSADDLPTELPYGPLRPTLVGIESLRALRLAADHLRWTDAEVADVFRGNAAELFGL